MSFRAPPQPTSERALETEKLIQERRTDVRRWAQMDSLATQWDARAVMAAHWIPSGTKVLDVGCGAMALGSALKSGCEYFPADVVERRPGAFVVDLNLRQFPTGQYDWVSFLGVLEYIHDPLWPLSQAHLAAPNLLATYCTYIGGDVSIRRGMGWVNDMTEADFEVRLQQAGWRVLQKQEVKRGPTNIQIMFVCERTSP